MEKLTIGSALTTTSTPYTIVKFLTGASVKVSNSVNIFSKCLVNTDEVRMTFFMGDNNSDTETFSVTGFDTKVAAIVQMPSGTLTVDGSDVIPTTLIGQYYAEKVVSTGAKVKWQNWSCLIAPRNTDVLIAQALEVFEKQKFQVVVMPNPSATEFIIMIKSASLQPGSIKIYDVRGKVVESVTNVIPSLRVRVGSQLMNGTYFAEVIQDGRREMVKLVKLR
jgi:hypothetical protein